MWGSALSTLGSIWNQSQQNRLQQQENEINRQFNSLEAQKNRDFQKQMFDAANKYNDPSSVVSRLVSAGVNPNLAFGGVQGSAVPPTGSTASSSGSIGSQLADFSGIQNMALIESQARKNNAEAERIESQTPLESQLLSTENDLRKANIDVQLSVKGLNDSEKQLLLERAKEVKQNVENLKTLNVINLREVNLKDIALKYADKIQSATFDEIKSKANLSNTEAFVALALYGVQYQKYLAEANLANFEFNVKQAMVDEIGFKGLGGIELDKALSSINKVLAETSVKRAESDIKKTEADFVEQEKELGLANSFLKVLFQILRALK